MKLYESISNTVLMNHASFLELQKFGICSFSIVVVASKAIAETLD